MRWFVAGMPSKLKNCKIALIDFNLQQYRAPMGIQVLITNPDKLEAIRQKFTPSPLPIIQKPISHTRMKMNALCVFLMFLSLCAFLLFVCVICFFFFFFPYSSQTVSAIFLFFNLKQLVGLNHLYHWGLSDNFQEFIFSTKKFSASDFFLVTIFFLANNKFDQRAWHCTWASGGDTQGRGECCINNKGTWWYGCQVLCWTWLYWCASL